MRTHGFGSADAPPAPFIQRGAHIAASIAANRSGLGWLELGRRFAAICRLLTDDKCLARSRRPQDEGTRDHTAMRARRCAPFQMRTGASAMRAIAALATSIEQRTRTDFARCNKAEATATRYSRIYWRCDATMRSASHINVRAQLDDTTNRR